MTTVLLHFAMRSSMLTIRDLWLCIGMTDDLSTCQNGYDGSPWDYDYG